MRLLGGLSGASFVLAGVAGAGCSAPVVDDVADANGVVTQGFVLVERSVHVGSAARSVEGGGLAADALLTNVSAKFMRLSAAADLELAERVVGAPFELPAPGGCMVLSPAGADEVALGSLGSIELLDAGDVTMKTGEVEMPLAARAFPDVGDLVFGVFYTSRDAASDLPAPARYTFESSGSGLLDRFAFDADAPGGPEDVRIGDAYLADGVDLDESVSAIVRWRAGMDGDPLAADDLVYVDVAAAGGAAVRCAFKDAGRGVIPGSFLRASTLGALPTVATVAVHRLRRAAFSASGVDLGEVRFDLSVIGRAQLATR